MNSTNSMQDTLALIGRALISYLFLVYGYAKITGFAGTVGFIASKGVPLPQVAAAIGLVMELGLGLMVLVGWQTRWAALGLAVFVVVVTPIFHNYWAAPAAQLAGQKLNFDKNVAILGALLLLAGFGAGRWSMDGRGRRAVPAMA